jgi:hypothetical protein
MVTWTALKYTPALEEIQGIVINPDKTMAFINGISIQLKDDGVDYGWWKGERNYLEHELKLPIPEWLRKYVKLEEIHLMTAASLQHVFPDIMNVDNMVFEQVYDWLRHYKIKKNQVEGFVGEDVEEDVEDVKEDVEEKFTRGPVDLIEGQNVNDPQLLPTTTAREVDIDGEINSIVALSSSDQDKIINDIKSMDPEDIYEMYVSYTDLWDSVKDRYALDYKDKYIETYEESIQPYLAAAFYRYQKSIFYERSQLPAKEMIELTSKGLPLLLWNTILGNVVRESPVSVNLEDCINKMMMTEHNDEEYIKRIRLYRNISDLGNPIHREDLLYVQSKIIRFITLEPKEVTDCLDIVYVVPDDLCKVGLSGDPMKILASFLDLEPGTTDKTQMKYMRAVSDKLVKYVPDIIKQIINISENYEKDKCNDIVHPNTLILKNVYENLFIKNNMMVMELPDLGISEFFVDFKQNILTKVILLAFIAYVFSKLLSLFNINYNVKN